MSAQRRLDKAGRLTARIVAEVNRAIALHAVWARCTGQPEVVAELAGEPAFALVRDALLIDLTMALCRLYEAGQDASATFHRLFRTLDDPTVGALLRCPDDHGAAVERYRSLQASGAIKRVRDLRDRVLAHNDTRGISRGPLAGDAASLVNASVDIAGLAHRAVTGSEPQFALCRETWASFADRFWARAKGNTSDHLTNRST
jgi:hypothetical protein